MSAPVATFDMAPKLLDQLEELLARRGLCLADALAGSRLLGDLREIVERNPLGGAPSGFEAARNSEGAWQTVTDKEPA